jgi:hypothetical protein
MGSLVPAEVIGYLNARLDPSDIPKSAPSRVCALAGRAKLLFGGGMRLTACFTCRNRHLPIAGSGETVNLTEYFRGLACVFSRRSPALMSGPFRWQKIFR